jgi:nucleoside 2-deoxyribosyltransferase
MKKIFIATAMSNLSKKEYLDLKAVIEEIKKDNPNYDIFSEITNINDHNSFMTPKEATILDVSEIEKCDEFILIHFCNVQSSTLFELGIAFSLKKRITIYYKDKKDVPFMLKELDKVGLNIKLEEFLNFKDIRITI